MSKIQIRKGLFETNSSSTHCIVIGNNGQNIYANLPQEVEFTTGKFGWEYEYYTDTYTKAQYLYTAILTTGQTDYLDQIKDVLKKWNIQCSFDEPTEFYYIDHSWELKFWVKEICQSEELLMNYLFCIDSFVETGNDNTCPIYLDEIEKPSNVLHEFEKGN